MKTRKSISLTTQTLITIMLFLLIAEAVIGGSLLIQSKRTMRTAIEDRMLDLANSAAVMVDPDALRRYQADPSDAESYSRVMQELAAFRDHSQIEYIYTVRHVSGDRYEFIIDSDPNAPGELGEEVKYTEALALAGSGQSAVDEKPYRDEWGRHYSAYSPILDGSGQVAAILVIDISADWYEKRITKYTMTILLGILLSLVFGAMIALIIIARLRNRVRDLGEELTALSADVDALVDEMKLPGERGKERQEAPETFSENEIAVLGLKLRATKNKLRGYLETVNSQTAGILASLASDYRSIYYVDLSADDGICYRSDPWLEKPIPEGEHFPARYFFESYAKQMIREDYREDFLLFLQPTRLRESFRKEKVLLFRYVVFRGGEERREMLRIAQAAGDSDRSDSFVQAVSIGILNIDRVKE